MKKGQTGIGLVILGVVAIIAVIGLVLLFTRASHQTGLSIGSDYTYPDAGISNTISMPPIGSPEIAYPAPPGMAAQTQITKGTRTPAYIISARFPQQGGNPSSGYPSIENYYGCDTDLIVGAKISQPDQQFNCYTVPQIAGTTDETQTMGPVGHYPQESSAQGRPPGSFAGKVGGDVYCYANTGGNGDVPDAEDRVRANIITQLVDHHAGISKFEWTTTMMNGMRVPVCWISAQTFPYPQG